MKKSDIVQAWKDERFRANLSAQQRDEMLADPAGEIELDDDSLGFAGANEGARDTITLTITTCQSLIPFIDKNTLPIVGQCVSIQLCPPGP